LKNITVLKLKRDNMEIDTPEVDKRIALILDMMDYKTLTGTSDRLYTKKIIKDLLDLFTEDEIPHPCQKLNL